MDRNCSTYCVLLCILSSHTIVVGLVHREADVEENIDNYIRKDTNFHNKQMTTHQMQHEIFTHKKENELTNTDYNTEYVSNHHITIPLHPLCDYCSQMNEDKQLFHENLPGKLGTYFFSLRIYLKNNSSHGQICDGQEEFNDLLDIISKEDETKFKENLCTVPFSFQNIRSDFETCGNAKGTIWSIDIYLHISNRSELETGNISAHNVEHVLRCTFALKNVGDNGGVPRNRTFVQKNDKWKNISFLVDFFENSSQNSFSIRISIKDFDSNGTPNFHSSEVPFLFLMLHRHHLHPFFLQILRINSLISFLAFMLVFLTAISREWRQNRSNIVLLNIAASSLFGKALLFAAAFAKIDESLCIAISLALSYFSLVEYLWTTLIAYMHYMRFVRVFEQHEKNFVAKATLFAWTTPIFVISATLLYTLKIRPKETYDTFSCSAINMLSSSAFVFLCIVLFVNSVFFLLIFQHLLLRKSHADHRSNNLAEAKLALILFFVLDLNVGLIIFGKFFRNVTIAIIFDITYTLQGAMLFVVFAIKNKNTRKLYSKWIKMLC